MRRDPELIRQLVLAIEADDETDLIECLESERVGYHSYLIVDAGLAKGTDVTTISDTLPQWQLTHLTSAGHDFADNVRSESAWKQVQTKMMSTGGSVSTEVLIELAKQAAKNLLGL